MNEQSLAARDAVKQTDVAVTDGVHSPRSVVWAGDGVSGGYLSAVPADRTISGCMVGSGDSPVIGCINNAHGLSPVDTQKGH